MDIVRGARKVSHQWQTLASREFEANRPGEKLCGHAKRLHSPVQPMIAGQLDILGNQVTGIAAAPPPSASLKRTLGLGNRPQVSPSACKKRNFGTAESN